MISIHGKAGLVVSLMRVRVLGPASFDKPSKVLQSGQSMGKWIAVSRVVRGLCLTHWLFLFESTAVIRVMFLFEKKGRKGLKVFTAAARKMH
ncbi:hypothetical protein OAX30_00590 [Pseudomonadales bacterium]|nr:hypothetical protein [Pseudomonadales bacterium]